MQSKTCDLNLSTYTKEFKKNMSIAFPIMMGQLGNVIVNIADNIMVGELGAAPLAAVSLANSVVFVAMSLGIGFSLGITPLVAESDGANDTQKGKGYFQNGVFMCMALGTFLFLGLLLIEPVLYHLDQPDEVIALAIPYYRIITFSIFPLMLFQAYKQFADGLSLTRYGMRATLWANVVNIACNYLLIYGIWIFPELGIIGAGYGTLISRFFMLAMLIYLFRNRDKFAAYRGDFGLKILDKTVLKKIVSIGLPTSLQMLFEVAVFASGVLLSGVLGTIPQASNQIALNLASMTYMVAVGLGVTATIRVGNQKGLKDFVSLRNIAFSIFLLMILIDVVFAVLFMVFNDTLPLFYIDDPAVTALAAQLLIIAALFQLSDGLQSVVLGALRGLQDVTKPMYLTFIAYWVIGFPCCYYLGLKTELKSTGIWLGLLIGLTASAVMLMYRFNKLSNNLIQNKKHELT